MLRIVEERASNHSLVLRLDGRLVTEWVEILRSSCEQAFSDGGPLSIDMTGLSFSDNEGIKLLIKLQHRRVMLINCSPFLREQLKQSISSDSPDAAHLK